MKEKILNLEIKHLFLALLLIPFILSSLDNYVKIFQDFLQSNIKTRISILQQNIKEDEQLPITTPPQLYLKNSKTYILMETLQELAKMPIADKRQTVLFIPQSNKLYWNWLPNPNAAPFIVPAVTGMAMIDGLPYGKPNFYGYESYILRTTQQLPQSQEEICQKAKTKGFSHVIIIDTDSNNRVITQKISCSIK